MRLTDAAETLETAYTVNKMTHDQGLWEKPTHTVTMNKPAGVVYDAHKKSERSEIVSTPQQTIHAKETFTGRTSTSHRVMDFLEAGKIISAAERISIGHTDWARFCYDPTACHLSIIRDEKSAVQIELRWADKSYLTLAKRMFCAWAVGNSRKVDLTRGPLYLRVAMVALANARHKAICGRELLSVADMCRWLGYKDADGANWYRGIKGHYRVMQRLIETLDADVLTSVSTTVGGMRDREGQCPL